MKHSELRHQPRHVNPRIQDVRTDNKNIYADFYSIYVG